MAKGKKTGGGTRKGRPNKRTLGLRLLREKADQAGEMPHEFLLRVSQSEKIDVPVRMDAAKAAAPYFAPRLASVEMTGPNGGPIEHRIAGARDAVAGKLARLGQGKA